MKKSSGAVKKVMTKKQADEIARKAQMLDDEQAELARDRRRSMNEDALIDARSFPFDVSL